MQTSILSRPTYLIDLSHEGRFKQLALSDFEVGMPGCIGNACASSCITIIVVVAVPFHTIGSSPWCRLVSIMAVKSKKLRFEILKRDSFTCNWCGKSAPDALLHVDHIHPESKGGTDEPTNLITACVDCNLGKGARTISDNSVVTKQKRTLDEINARRLQLEMMFEWRKELDQHKAKRLDDFCAYWASLSGWNLNPTGRKQMRTLLNNRRGISDESILEAMAVSIETYLDFDDEGVPLQKTAELAFKKIGGVLYTKQKEAEKPGFKDLFYVRGILRKTCPIYLPPNVMELLEDAFDSGIATRDMKSAAKTVGAWSQFEIAMESFAPRHTSPPKAIVTKPIYDAEQESLRDRSMARFRVDHRLSDNEAYDIQMFLDGYSEKAFETAYSYCESLEPSLGDLVANLLEETQDDPDAPPLVLLNRLVRSDFAEIKTRSPPFLYYIEYSINWIGFQEEVYSLFETALSSLLDGTQFHFVQHRNGWAGGLEAWSSIRRALQLVCQNVLGDGGIEYAGLRAQSILKFYGFQSCADVVDVIINNFASTTWDWGDITRYLDSVHLVDASTLRSKDDVLEYMSLFRNCNHTFRAIDIEDGVFRLVKADNWDHWMSLARTGLGTDLNS